MKYKVKTFDNKTILITNKCINEKEVYMAIDEPIITNMITSFHLFENNKKKRIEWSFKVINDNLKLQLEIDDNIFMEDIDDEQLIDELIKLIEENSVIEKCDFLYKVMNKIYNKAFIYYLKNYGDILLSNYYIENIIKVSFKGNEIGTATRCQINFSDNEIYLNLAEYTGVSLLSNMDLDIDIYVENQVIRLSFAKKDEDIFYKYIHDSNDIIGYFKLEDLIIRRITVLQDNEVKNINKNMRLNVLSIKASTKDLLKYIIHNNSMEAIEKYKEFYKAEKTLININTYMVNEFMI